MDWKSPCVARDDRNLRQDALTMLVGIWYTIAHALRRTTSRRPGHLERMLVEQDSQLKPSHARHAAEIQAAVDEAVQAAVAKAIKETTALFLAALLRSAKRTLRSAATLALRPEDRRDAAGRGEHRRGIAGRTDDSLAAKRHKHGRRPLPDHLPRHPTSSTIWMTPRSRVRLAANPRQRIGQEVSEQLEYLPASFKRLRHIRHKYGCRRCEHDGYNPQIATAAKPRNRSTRDCPGRACWPMSQRASWATICRCIAWSTFHAAKHSDCPRRRARGLRPRENWSGRWWRE